MMRFVLKSGQNHFRITDDSDEITSIYLANTRRPNNRQGCKCNVEIGEAALTVLFIVQGHNGLPTALDSH